MTGGAVKNACELVREKVLEIGRRKKGTYHPAWATAELLLEGGKVVTDGGEVLADLVEVLEGEVVEVEEEWRHRPTVPFDLVTGQGNGHVQYSFAAHRAVVEVDTELGLVKVIELACAQDVGKALNPLSVVGQIQGGTLQGMGIAVMEEIVVDPKTAKVRNPSFTDYLLPTILDTPTIPVDVLELADDHAPYGLRGIGEAPTLSSTCGRPRGDPQRDGPGARPDPGSTRAPHGNGPGLTKLSGRCVPPRNVTLPSPHRPEPSSTAPLAVLSSTTSTEGTTSSTSTNRHNTSSTVSCVTQLRITPFVSGRPPGRAAHASSQIPRSPTTFVRVSL